MAKSKNHTNKNQIKKAHKNGIKKTWRNTTIPSLRGRDPAFVRNRRATVKSQHAHANAKALGLPLPEKRPRVLKVVKVPTKAASKAPAGKSTGKPAAKAAPKK